MIKVGLTGGIGAGKSIVSKIFANLGIQIYDSDYQAKLLYLTNESLKLELIHMFGVNVYTPAGTLNKQYLAEIVFNDNNKLKQLNQIVHPRVKTHFENWIDHCKRNPYIIKEAAILFESGANKFLDKVIVVEAPLEIRISRVIERDAVFRDEVLKRMQNQLPQEEIVKKANYVIVNDDIQLILPQVFYIHDELLKLSRKLG
jgi:dephospho-CoA kinase